MKKSIIKLFVALCGVLCLLSACQSKQDAWVTYKATVDGNVTLQALAVQEVMNQRIEAALGASTAGLYLDNKANDNAAISACDGVYAESGQGSTSNFTILLNKSYPNTNPDNIKTITLKTYNYTKH